MTDALITQVGRGDRTPEKRSNVDDLSSKVSNLTIGNGSGKCLLPKIKSNNVGKKTLVLDLDETLVHSSFKKLSTADFLVPVDIEGIVHTVYVLKRPYTDQFLAEAAKLYEVVLFTASLSKYADPLLNMLDTTKAIEHRLFREHCTQQMTQMSHGYVYIKNLAILGRELKNCIIVDNSPQSYAFQPHHAIAIPSWFDDQKDTALLDLIPVLRHLTTVDDVSTCLGKPSSKPKGRREAKRFSDLIKEYGKPS